MPQEEIGVSFFKNNPNLTLSGQKTVVVIIDTGIDYLHEDFIYPDGSSKILYLWDQTKGDKPPQNFYIGTEYTKEEIGEAIKNKDSSLSKDEEGHGTMISGIIAGLGNVNKSYEGIAKDANIIVVKMQKIDGYYNNAMLSAAIDYAYQKANELNLATIINISMGSNALAGFADVISPEDSYFSNGVCMIAAAGNEGNAETHTLGTIKKDEEKTINIQVQELEKMLRIEVWMNKHDRIKLKLVSPSGEVSKNIDSTNYDLVKGVFDLEQTAYSIRYNYPTSYSGQEHMVIYMQDIKPGIWQLKITGDYINTGIYNMYLENREFLNKTTKFSESTPDYTINYPAVQQNIITIGTYNSISESVWVSSSRGPSLVDRQKPDVVSPGVNIIGPYPNNEYATITGSSPAGACASGVVSLFYEYIISKEIYPKKGFVQMVRTYMQAGATRGNAQYPNEIQGYGILNLRGMFDELI